MVQVKQNVISDPSAVFFPYPPKPVTLVGVAFTVAVPPVELNTKSEVTTVSFPLVRALVHFRWLLAARTSVSKQ